MLINNRINNVSHSTPSELPMSFQFEVKGQLLETTPVFKQYWHFAAERQKIFFKRIT